MLINQREELLSSFFGTITSINVFDHIEKIVIDWEEYIASECMLVHHSHHEVS